MALPISTEQVTMRFGRLTALDRVSLSIEPGSIFGLLGPNGSGKSTLIRILCGLLVPTSGRALIDGTDMARHPRRMKPIVGYMSQRFSLYSDLTVWENLTFYGFAYGMERSALAGARHRVVELVGLGPYVRHRAGRLSGGWKQRLAFACALLHGPRILFLDEPTAGIDPVARRQIWDMLFELSGTGVTLFVSTHYMDEAERCSHVGYVYFAKLLVSGRPDELKSLAEATPAGMRWLGIESREAGRALGVVRGVRGVRRPTIFGRSVRALVEDAVAVEELERALAEGGIGDARVRAVQPTLEDVFVTFAQRESGSAP
jgi:ABC-type multidrug transport system ATPase subunit